MSLPPRNFHSIVLQNLLQIEYFHALIRQITVHIQLCVIIWQFRQAVSKFMPPAQTSSSSKNAYPLCELKNAFAFLISRSDIQCFSHEDGCFAPETNCKYSLSELPPPQSASKWTSAPYFLTFHLCKRHFIDIPLSKWYICLQDKQLRTCVRDYLLRV